MRMRTLTTLTTLPLVLLACGNGSPSATSASRHLGCSRVEVSRAQADVAGGRATVGWEVASAADVRGFLVEQRNAEGTFERARTLPATARSGRLKGLANGPSELRVWALLKPHGSSARGAAARRAPASAATVPIAVGLNAGFWGPCEPGELSTAIKNVRLDTPADIAPWTRAGLRVIADESGPYVQAGVSGLDAAAYVRRVVAFVEANPQVWAIEVLNEPGNPYFWGREAGSPANRAAYASLVVAVHDALAARFGARRPLILASYDGGYGSNAWGEGWTQNATALADADMVTVHPYGFSPPRAVASLGNRASVEYAHAHTGKPVAITEVGWPTNGASAESGPIEYSEAEQARNIARFVAWARATGYVKSLTIYNYRDTAEGGGFGVQTHAGATKLAWFALIRAARQAER